MHIQWRGRWIIMMERWLDNNGRSEKASLDNNDGEMVRQ